MDSEDTLYARGFLSKEIASYTERYRQDFATVFETCESRSHAATAALYNANIAHLVDPARQHELVALAFWCRCLSACQGALLLAERGMAPEAGSLLRTAVEFLFYGAALLADPGVLDSLIDGDKHARLKQAKAMLKDGKAAGTLAAEQVDSLNELIAAIDKTKPTIDAYSAAEKANLANLYSTVYRGMSLVSSHATLAATNSVFQIDETGNLQLIFGPSPENLDFYLGLIAVCLATGMARFDTLVQPPSGD